MARVEINMIEQFVFETQLDVRITDLNYGNHVGNDSHISLLHEARARFLAHFNLSEQDIDGKRLTLADLAVNFKSQAFYGNRLKFQVGIGEFNKYGFDLFYRVSNAEDNRLVLQAKTGMVFVDQSRKHVQRVPESFLSLFSQQQAG